MEERVVHNYLIEVHTTDNQVEHYLVQDRETEDAARESLTMYFKSRNYQLSPNFQTTLGDAKYHFYVFRVVELPDDPVVFITGEYRSSYPL